MTRATRLSIKYFTLAQLWATSFWLARVGGAVLLVALIVTGLVMFKH